MSCVFFFCWLGGGCGWGTKADAWGMYRNGDVDKGTTKAILEKARVLAPELLDADGGFDVVSEQVGLRPSREGGPRVEFEEVDGKKVVHSYGHSGAG